MVILVLTVTLNKWLDSASIATYSGVLGRGGLVKSQLDKAIGSKLSPDNTPCTDAWGAFSTYAKNKGIVKRNLIGLIPNLKCDGSVNL